MSDAPSSKGYGKWIRIDPHVPDEWAWAADVARHYALNAERLRSIAAEMLAMADAHDTVTLVVKRATAQHAAEAVGWSMTHPFNLDMHRAARKALGMEP